MTRGRHSDPARDFDLPSRAAGRAPARRAKPAGKWRITLQELMAITRTSPADLNRWARLGAFGPRWAETTENKWRHIDRLTAQRAVLMNRFLEAGMSEERAARAAFQAHPKVIRDTMTEATYGEGRHRVTVELSAGELP